MSFPEGGYGFQNAPVTGDGTLVVPALRSPNYGEDAEGNILGWSLNKDGSAAFTNVTVGNDNFFIDMNGDAAFNNASIDGTLTVHGDSIDDLLADKAGGVQVCNTMLTDSSAYTGTPVLINKLTILNFSPDRQYTIGGIGVINPAGTNPSYMQIFARYSWDTDATTASPILFIGQNSTRNVNWNFNLHFTFRNPTPEGTNFHISFYMVAQVNGSFYDAADGYGRIWYEDAGPAVPFNEFVPVSGGGSGDDPPQQHVSTFNAQWGTSYRGGGASCGSDFSRFNQGGVLYQGYYSGCNANTRSWIGFNWDIIADTLSGSTVTKCELYLKNSHWYFNGGGTAIIGTHNSTFLTAGDTGPSYNGDLDNVDRLRVDWAVGASKWVNLGTTIGNEFKNGSTKGIVLGPGLSTSKTYYGHFYDATGSGQPMLRFTYTK